MSNKIDEYHYERGYVYNFHFHLIWCTKYRNKVFSTPELVNDMKELLQYIAKLNEVEIEAMEVMPDHIHMLISFKPKKCPTDIVKAFKGGSGRMFLEQHPEVKKQYYWGTSHLWSASYFMSTLGNMSKEVVENYINSQYENEKKKTAK